MADACRRWTVYNYAYNNPIRFIDPDGMLAEDVSGGIQLSGADAQGFFAAFKSGLKKGSDGAFADYNQKEGYKNGENEDNMFSKHGPGMWYDSEDAAAAGWASYYGPTTMYDRMERGSIIYYFMHNDITYYSFSEALLESPNGKYIDFPDNLSDLIPDYAKKGATVCSSIHSHPDQCINANKDFSDDRYNSKGDIGRIIGNNPTKNHYLLNFYGELKVYRREKDAAIVGKQKEVKRYVRIGTDFAEQIFNCDSGGKTANFENMGNVTEYFNWIGEFDEKKDGYKNWQPVFGKGGVKLKRKTK